MKSYQKNTTMPILCRSQKSHQLSNLNNFIYILILSLISTTAFADWEITNHNAEAFSKLATVPGVRVLTGDFNGDGTTDIALLKTTPGWKSMPVAYFNKNGDWTITNNDIGDFAQWATAPKVEILTGDFDCNGTTDVALLNKEAGWDTMPVAYSTYSNNNVIWTITNRKIGDFAKWATWPSVKIFTGNFRGRKVNSIGEVNFGECTDLVLLNQGRGWDTMPMAFLDDNLESWIITNRTSGNFAYQAQDNGVIALKGDFNNDGRKDIALIKTGPFILGSNPKILGSDIPLALSRGRGYWKTIVSDGKFFPTWLRDKPFTQHFFFTGDFDGNGTADIAALRPPAIGVASSKPDSDWHFTESNSDKWGLYNIYLTGNFDDNKNTTEIVLLSTESNSSTIPVASYTNDGNWRFSNCHSVSSTGNFSSWLREKSVEILTGDFDGDGRTDIALVRKETGWNTIPVALSRADSSNCNPPATPPLNPPSCSEACKVDYDICIQSGKKIPQCKQEYKYCIQIDCSGN